MPSPDVLQEYERVVPGAADRILAMAESDTTERAALDRKLADAEIENARGGRNQAYSLTLTALVAAIVFFALGNPVAGAVLLSMPVVMLIRSFLGGGDR